MRKDAAQILQRRYFGGGTVLACSADSSFVRCTYYSQDRQSSLLMLDHLWVQMVACLWLWVLCVYCEMPNGLPCKQHCRRCVFSSMQTCLHLAKTSVHDCLKSEILLFSGGERVRQGLRMAPTHTWELRPSLTASTSYQGWGDSQPFIIMLSI